MCDLTALDWSPDGNYLAVASYDAVMRVLTKTGDTYMSSPQHKVGITLYRLAVETESDLRRARCSHPSFQVQAQDY
jgi:WD40 repeat protein